MGTQYGAQGHGELGHGDPNAAAVDFDRVHRTPRKTRGTSVGCHAPVECGGTPVEHTDTRLGHAAGIEGDRVEQPGTPVGCAGTRQSVRGELGEAVGDTGMAARDARTVREDAQGARGPR